MYVKKRRPPSNETMRRTVLARPTRRPYSKSRVTLFTTPPPFFSLPSAISLSFIDRFPFSWRCFIRADESVIIEMQVPFFSPRDDGLLLDRSAMPLHDLHVASDLGAIYSVRRQQFTRLDSRFSVSTRRRSSSIRQSVGNRPIRIALISRSSMIRLR